MVGKIFSHLFYGLDFHTEFRGFVPHLQDQGIEPPMPAINLLTRQHLAFSFLTLLHPCVCNSIVVVKVFDYV